MHEHVMWKEGGAPPNDGRDYLFADRYNVAWYLGHANIGYISFSTPHEGGGVQINLGIETIAGNNTGAGGDASVFINIGSCGGYYDTRHDTRCVEDNWHNNVRQMLAFGGSPVVSKLQATEFMEELEKGKDNQSAWHDVMHANHEEPFKENNPVVYTYAAASELQGTELATIADNANILTGDWVKQPLPASLSVMGISSHSGEQNLGVNVETCLPQSAPISCQ